eukprot:NODE_1695_length_908_cov_182.393481_g1181_i0.p1 GENE.NODE_1695_length_908_cov_182.393481_g1181_i0~~NODE_1695_length_908_cov_182.393481_g1181_i0.p1  ORF type:complete len:226 (-),score=78.02 NODE_1695_length_908_cov_182.393481_g1181_i0:100-777(-)
MGDPADEQQSELEALEAIYCDDFEYTTKNPPRFSILLKDDCSGRAVKLVVEFPPKYPHVSPNITCMPASEILKHQAEQLTAKLQAEAAASVGEVVIFTLAQCTLEFLAEIPANGEEVEEEVDPLAKPRPTDAAAIRHGNCVTLENFMEWKKKFDKERAQIIDGRAKAKLAEMELKKDRLTGRQYFNKMAANINWELFEDDSGIFADDEELPEFDDDDEWRFPAWR